MRTITRHWPRKAPRGDVQSLCDYCGAVWRLSELKRDESGLLACPDEGPGKDLVALGRLNAAGAREHTGPRTIAPAGRLSKDGKEYANNPQSILEEKLIGWWSRESISVSGNTDDYLYGEIQASDRVRYGALAGLTAAEVAAETLPASPRSGVTSWRNMAKRYDYQEVDSTNPHRDSFLDLNSRSVFSPGHDDGTTTFDSTFVFGNGYATRRLYNYNSQLVMAAGTNPCVWVVFKPTGNEVNSSSDPDDHSDYSLLFGLKRKVAKYNATDSNSDDFTIQWGHSTLGTNAVHKFWHTRAIYSAGSIKAYASGDLNGDTSRRVYSARMEANQLVFKVSDTEFITPLSAADDLEYPMYNVTIGDYVNGEIDEVVLMAEQPSADQITDMETYFSKAYSDLAVTL